MLITFCFGVSSNLSQQKSLTAEILRINFLQKTVLRKYMHKTSAIGLFCCHKFEEIPKQKLINMSKLNKLHFKTTRVKITRRGWIFHPKAPWHTLNWDFCLHELFVVRTWKDKSSYLTNVTHWHSNKSIDRPPFFWYYIRKWRHFQY